jgi:hypothetical protein
MIKDIVSVLRVYRRTAFENDFNNRTENLKNFEYITIYNIISYTVVFFANMQSLNLILDQFS